MSIKTYVLIVTDPGKTKSVFDRIKEVERVVEVHQVMGPYDILVEIEVDSLQDVPSVLGEKIRVVEGVQSTTSLVALPD